MYFETLIHKKTFIQACTLLTRTILTSSTSPFCDPAYCPLLGQYVRKYRVAVQILLRQPISQMEEDQNTRGIRILRQYFNILSYLQMATYPLLPIHESKVNDTYVNIKKSIYV